MNNQPAISHGQTVGGIVLCALGVVIATPVVKFIGIYLWRMQDSFWFIPDQLSYYVIQFPTETMMAVGASALPMIITLSVLKRADASIVAYVVSTIYILIFCGFLAMIYSSGSSLNNALVALGQFVGTIAGFWIGREQMLADSH